MTRYGVNNFTSIWINLPPLKVIKNFMSNLLMPVQPVQSETGRDTTRAVENEIVLIFFPL